jgi:23S rRNA pseudouridine1911/1915/1917 synthase
MTIKLSATPEHKNQRLDKFLVEKLQQNNPEFSRSRIQDLIEKFCVVEEKTKKVIDDSSYKIKGLEDFVIEIPDAIQSKVLAKDIAIDVVWEDENMMVINKSAGLTTHPGNGNQDNTLVNALLFRCQNNLSGINGVMRPGIVHRLDKDTSGLMVVAKNDLAHMELSKQIENRTLKRHYLAICFGVPKPLNGKITKNIGRSKINRLKMIITKIGGRSAITNYSVQKLYQGGVFSLVECRLETGRTHQIRVHMSAISHSLIGDQTYGARKKSLDDIDPELKDFVNEFPRQALHSYQISFLHPVSKEEMSFEVEFPKDLKELVKKLES